VDLGEAAAVVPDLAVVRRALEPVEDKFVALAALGRLELVGKRVGEVGLELDEGSEGEGVNVALGVTVEPAFKDEGAEQGLGVGLGEGGLERGGDVEGFGPGDGVAEVRGNDDALDLCGEETVSSMASNHKRPAAPAGGRR
jgi:hypothetical protein